jgi:methoxymalonate biosynthesis acyl carrier protein
MQIDEAMQELRGFIRENFKIPAHDRDFNDDVHLFDYGYVDSFGAVDLTAFLERKFAVRVSDGDLMAHPFNTIREISSFVIKRLKGEI